MSENPRGMGRAQGGELDLTAGWVGILESQMVLSVWEFGLASRRGVVSVLYEIS